ncbi:hypothetical protein M3223_02310 [Paenibacillus pasadenensis]|uniref:hypothetical protein n=1 Tax=Paenibacillus pasadenensis TaxID=217090 RepID=UPI00203C7D01|nr:hypothetical protein [Paenibacillus pasadenensis]MCM3746182.1 hypothetical protein [Paenibacillus pasadenensis]
MKLGMILVLFILLVIIVQTFGSYHRRFSGDRNENGNENGNGALNRESFRIINETSSITFTYISTPGSIEPSPSNILAPNGGENFFELPFVLGSWISRTVFYIGTFPDGSNAGTLQFTLDERNLFVSGRYFRSTSITAVSVPVGTIENTSSLRLIIRDNTALF